MSNLTFYWGLFWSYVAQYAKGRMEYRWDFVIGLVTDLLFQSVAIIFLLVVFQQVPTLAGWSQPEVFFIYGYFLWPYALFGMISNGIFDFTDRYIVRGEMDRLLLRPVNSLFQLIMEGVALEPLMGFLTGSAIMIWAGRELGLLWQWYDPLVLILLTIGSTMVYLGVYLSLATIGFWYDGRTGLLPLLWNVNNYGRYPVAIYGGVLRAVLTWVLPFAFVGFYPAAYFLRREVYLVWSAVTPLVGLVFLSLAVLLWRSGIKRYHSTGS
jgi:ABC-2 type transport system permease protein